MSALNDRNPHQAAAPCLLLQEAPKRGRWTLGGTKKVSPPKQQQQQQQKQQPRGRPTPKPKQVRSHAALPAFLATICCFGHHCTIAVAMGLCQRMQHFESA